MEYRDYGEIAVTRRLYRDGMSEYLLNKTQVRLKDVIDVFLGTGVGTKAYSIVEQGKIGLIVSARAEDRRALVEEAAGITKYKSRKKASERKMELTEQNLLRVGDCVIELERNVASLQRQAAKAERYVSYRSELEQLVLHQASHQLLDMLASEKYWTAERATSEKSVQSARTQLEVAEAALELERAQALELETSAEQAQNAAFSADNEVRALEAELSREKDKLEHLSQRFDAARLEQIDLRTKADALEGERAEAMATLQELEADETREAQVALVEHEELESLRAEERTADAALVNLRTRASQAASQVAAAKAKLSGLERRTLEMKAREAKLRDELATLRAQLAQLASHRTGLTRTGAGLGAVRKSAAEERADLEQQLASLRQELQGSEHALDPGRTALASPRGALHALEEMRARLEGV